MFPTRGRGPRRPATRRNVRRTPGLPHRRPRERAQRGRVLTREIARVIGGGVKCWCSQLAESHPHPGDAYSHMISRAPPFEFSPVWHDARPRPGRVLSLRVTVVARRACRRIEQLVHILNREGRGLRADGDERRQVGGVGADDDQKEEGEAEVMPPGTEETGRSRESPVPKNLRKLLVAAEGPSPRLN